MVTKREEPQSDDEMMVKRVEMVPIVGEIMVIVVGHQ